MLASLKSKEHKVTTIRDRKEDMGFKLPSGWSKEQGQSVHTFVLQAPCVAGKSSGGFVTVDEKKRGYALGCYSHVFPMPYAGLEWKAKLYAAAAAALEQVSSDPWKGASRAS